MRIRSPIPFLLAPLAAALPAQSIVRDLTPAAASSAGSNPGPAVVQGNVAWFAITDAYDRDRRVAEELAAVLRQLFPALTDAAIDHH